VIELFVWDYVSNLGGSLAPHPKHHVLAKDLRTYRDNHAVGVFLEGESLGATDFIALNCEDSPERDEGIGRC
jgi:hypothetical protein